MRSPSVDRLMLSSSAAFDLLPSADLQRPADQVRLDFLEPIVERDRRRLGDRQLGQRRRRTRRRRAEQHAGRQAADAHRAAGAGLDDPLARVLELAHVARPAVARRTRDAPPAKSSGTSMPRSRAKRLKKKSRQQRDVLAPLAQRRQHDRQHVQPVVQVLAELAFGDHLLEIALACR